MPKTKSPAGVSPRPVDTENSVRPEAVDQRQIRWINQLSAGLNISDLASAARLLHDLSGRLENTAPAGQNGNDDDDTA